MYKVVELVGGGSVINGAYPVKFLSRTFLSYMCTHIFKRPDYSPASSPELRQSLATLALDRGL